VPAYQLPGMSNIVKRIIALAAVAAFFGSMGTSCGRPNWRTLACPQAMCSDLGSEEHHACDGMAPGRVDKARSLADRFSAPQLEITMMPRPATATQ